MELINFNNETTGRPLLIRFYNLYSMIRRIKLTDFVHFGPHILGCALLFISPRWVGMAEKGDEVGISQFFARIIETEVSFRNERRSDWDRTFNAVMQPVQR